MLLERHFGGALALSVPVADAYFGCLFEVGWARFEAAAFFAAVFRGARFAAAFVAGGRAIESRSSTRAKPVLTSSSETPR